MKIIAIILITSIFILFGLMKFQGYFDLGIINLIGYGDNFDVDLGFIKNTFDYIYYIPDLIFNSEKENIKNIFSPSYPLGNKEAFLIVLGLFFGIIISIMTYILKFFPRKNDKTLLILGVIISYILVIEFMK